MAVLLAGAWIGYGLWKLYNTLSSSPDLLGLGSLVVQEILKAEKETPISQEQIKTFKASYEKKYNYNKKGNIVVTTTILENGLGINQGEFSFKEVVDDTLDTKDIDDMILAAKFGEWDKVWSTLDNKPYIVNCIPEKRAWSVLHQAIYLGDLNAVRILLEKYGADIAVRTLEDKDKKAETGTDAFTLAKNLGKIEIKSYIIQHELLRKRCMKDKDLSYFVLHENGHVFPFNKYPLLQITLASYKSTFFQNYNYHSCKSMHIAKILKDVLLNSDHTWTEARSKIHSILYGIDRRIAKYLLDCTDKNMFFELIIRIYTEECDVYHNLTQAFAKQPNMPYMPLSADLAVGPFALVLGSILLHWDGLEPSNKTTYRGINDDVTDSYKEGESLLFSSFVSSSKLKSVAEPFCKTGGTLFIFDNSANSKWQPRLIERYSRYPPEEECLYPLGAEFEVLRVDKQSRQVHLKLLDPST